ncbi:phytoene desaturase [Streptomyces sp. Amel2xB2]|uniref:phytoene desaturase family protein n=1 Tax=Streptomyces sp. Amel2xB2 TaxID=1305829 RepID=UPI000DB9C914|nr:phytoene desaturase family protein [Streptomyces sp. Amel2xB2]RAJ66449.1 phytoene desaturase [Streptomyces sp. Amel2xB2]
MRTLPGRTDEVVVVGAGLSGLAAALYLAGAGRNVTVVESADGPGGRAGRIEERGYLLDTGPTVLTMPHLIEEAIAAAGGTMSRHIELLPLHPAYRARFADGTHIDVHTGADAMEAEVRRAAGAAEAAGYRRLRRWLGELHRVQMRSFIDANFDSPLGLLTPDLARLAALGGFGTWHGRVARFVRDERLRRIFSFQALYAGVPPARALAAYAVIAYMDTVAGVYFPRGGMYAVPLGMAAAARQAGVVFRHRTTVTRVERSPSGRASAVHTADGARIPCDALVLTCDLPVAHRLLGGAPRRPLPLRFAPSAFVLHTGGRTGERGGGHREGPGPAHHTLSFGAAWHRTFRQLTRTGELMSDPSLLITTPTVTDPTLAPPGRTLRYVLAPCPNLATGPHNWRAIAPHYRDGLLATLRERGIDGFGDAAGTDTRTDVDVELERMVTPADWAARGHPAGTPFSAAHTFAQTGPFRTGNLPPGWENVVLAGCGTTPGVGVPTVLVSGKLAAARVTGLHRTAPRTRRPGAGRPRATVPSDGGRTTDPAREPAAATSPGTPARTPER